MTNGEGFRPFNLSSFQSHSDGNPPRHGVSLVGEIIDGALVLHHFGAAVDTSNIDEIRRSRSLAIGHSEYDQQQWPGIFREHSRGFLGTPTISGHRSGESWSTRFEIESLSSSDKKVIFSAVDSDAELRFEGEISIDEFSIVKCDYRLTNLGESYTLNQFNYWLPLPARAVEKMDFAGRWSNERQPQRSRIDIGLWSRDSREGRSSHNFTITSMAMSEEANFNSGEVWAVALGWSGNSSHYIESSYTGEKSIGAGEILFPGEVILEKGESYQAPTLFASYSRAGLDGISANFHQHLRARPSHPRKPRPLTLNMWEAIYFEHSMERVKPIINLASELGVERVVLDDGWFGDRRDDRRGLGDWKISSEVWPEGLRPLSDYIHSKGMEFGLWFEGEMVNPDSDLYRKHPDWILSSAGRVPPTWRHQLVLDISKSEVFDYLVTTMSEVISANKVDYIKWDHNRVLVDAGSNGRAGYRKQVLAIYRLFDELKRANPGLEIESCASGGARIDLGVIDHVDRFWTSDNNDALARQSIQRWSAQIIPPELLGTHIGPSPGHQTGRSTPLSMRAATALFGHAGIEWDITQATSSEREFIKSWATFYQENRSWLHQSRVVRVDHSDPAALLYGFLSEERALFTYVQMVPSLTAHPDVMRLTGLQASASYHVRAIFPAGEPKEMAHASVPWISGITMSGSELAYIGLTTPILAPENALLIYVEKVKKES